MNPLRTLLISVIALSMAAAAGGRDAPLDVLITGGIVIDGSGAPGRTADVGIRDGKIVAVGDLKQSQSRSVLDVRGLVVAPGFIDVHNHVPEAVPRLSGPLINEAFLTQGVTTLIGGPDGGLAPAQIAAIVKKLERDGSSENYAFYVGHNGIRRQVMGLDRRAATGDEIEKMKTLVREGMEMGCVGFSTGLMYEPGLFSAPDEVVALAREVQPYGGTYDTHTRNPVFDLLGSDREAIEIGKQAGISTKIGHIKPVGLVNKGRSADEIALVEQARAAGQDVVTDQYPYDGAALRTLDALIVIPGMANDTRGLDTEIVRAALRDPARRLAIKIASEQGIDGGFAWIKSVGYGSLRIVHAPDDPRIVGKNIELFAAERRMEPFDLLAELILTHASPISTTLGALEESDLRAELAMPWNMISSDGQYLDPQSKSPLHPRYTGSFPRVLGHYVRDVRLFPLEEAVRKMTSLPAEHLHLAGRGRIEIGYAADITVFNAQRVRDRSTWADPAALSEGIEHVLVNGVTVLSHGKPTGVTPGSFLPREAARRRPM